MTQPTASSQELDTISKAVQVSRQLLLLLNHQEKPDEDRLSALTVRLPRSLLLTIRQQAIQRGVSISEVVRTSLS